MFKFGEAFGEKRVILGCGVRFHQNEENIVVPLKYWLPFLRIFGSKISYVLLSEFNHILPIERVDPVEKHINQYCAKTLTKIDFREYVFTNENIQEEFKNVQEVSISKTTVFLPHLAKWFPKMHRLEMDHVEMRLPGRCIISANDAITFLARMDSLKKVIFSVEGRAKCVRLLNQVGNEWQRETRNGSENRFYIVLSR